MISALDIAYTSFVAASAPYWLIAPKARRKVLTALRQRMGHVASRDLSRPAVMIHAVSLGEMNATRALVTELRQARPDLQFILSTTTDTGFKRGQELYGNDRDITLIRYPLDFTSAIERVLKSLRPDVVVLMELELWPNFLRLCRRRRIPVILVNGRLTPYSFRRYRLIKPIARWMFRGVASVCAQDEIYAKRFIDLGADPATVQVTGTMKFDTAHVADRIEGDDQLAEEVGLKTGEPLWVCGSTGPGEEKTCLDIYRNLQENFPTLRLAIIPRKPERFDEVAALITACGFALTRRSQPDKRKENAVILGDTMGELRKFYSLATIVFVGRTIVDLGPRQHGSDMIEPAALAKAVIIGPYTANFADVMTRLKQSNAIIEVQDATELQSSLYKMLAATEEIAAVGRRAQQVVVEQQGATRRHAKIILSNLASPGPFPRVPREH